MFGKNMFSSKSGFLNIFRRKSQSNDPSRLDWTMRCPRCDVEMRKVTKMGVTIDVCDRCGGMWLDKGEMDSLNRMKPVQQVEEYPMPRSAPKKKKTSKKKS